jgi:maleate isomerase
MNTVFSSAASRSEAAERSGSGKPATNDGLAPARAGIGIITPSANVVVESVAIDFVRAFPEVSVHFSRVPVLGTADPHPDGYDWWGMRAAARLLADAAPRSLLWAGSKGALVGIEQDRRLCDLLTDAVGIPITTPTLALEQLARLSGFRRVALISPYTDQYQVRLVGGLEHMGFTCVAEAHSGLADNLSYAGVPSEEIRAMARRVATSRPDVILAWCTNLAAAPLAAGIEAETGHPLWDAMSLGLWSAFGLMGIDSARAASTWGGPFRHQAPKA